MPIPHSKNHKLCQSLQWLTFRKSMASFCLYLISLSITVEIIGIHFCSQYFPPLTSKKAHFQFRCFQLFLWNPPNWFLIASPFPSPLPGRYIQSGGFVDIYHCVCTCSIMSDSLQPMDCSPPGSSVLGILQTRILEWVAMPSFRGSFQPRDQTQVSGIVGRFFTAWATSEAISKLLFPFVIFSIKSRSI